jgi:hypothetical protein
LDKAPRNEGGDQEKMRAGAVGRMAALGAAGARVGINYLKHYGRGMVAGGDPEGRRKLREELDERNAETVYDTFSKLKGGPLKLAQMRQHMNMLMATVDLGPPRFVNY